jgi:hypothetical protein
MKRRNALIGFVSCLGIMVLGCVKTDGPTTSETTVVEATGSETTIIGRLVSLNDMRPVDGGVDLTVETEGGKQEILRVGSAFIAGPREQVLALHQVVDAAKVGDRLRASGKRDESGALAVERLEIVKR